MIVFTYIFWISILILCYTYLVYPFLLFLIDKIFQKPEKKDVEVVCYPSMTLIIPAYNEMEFLAQKLDNIKKIIYPRAKLKIYFVTDGSDDGSEIYLQNKPNIQCFHQAERKGKIAAMNRISQIVDTDLIVFSDANAMLNEEVLMHIAEKFSDDSVGCVAGEKRVASNMKAGEGEGIYWKYESAIKRRTASLYSAIGAAGEIFAIRTQLYTAPLGDTILDDFIISLEVVRKGYKIAYCPKAYACEEGSQNLKEELKRKIRIAAGGLQAIRRTLDLLNPIQYPVFSFHYLSHRVLRWTITPFLLPIAFGTNLVLALSQGETYWILFAGQIIFYLMAYWGYQKSKPHKLSLIACYFTMMHWAVILGWKRYLLKQQTVLWQRSERAI